MRHLTIWLLLLALVASGCAPAQTDLGGLSIPSQWRLESFGMEGAEAAVIEGSNITLGFDANGQLSGNGGCNSFGAKYAIEGNTLNITDLTSTLIACAEEALTSQEQQFFDALRTATKVEISGDSLTIWYGDGQSKLNFVKEPAG